MVPIMNNLLATIVNEIYAPWCEVLYNIVVFSSLVFIIFSNLSNIMAHDKYERIMEQLQ